MFKYFPHTPDDIQAMLDVIGVSSLDDLYAEVPEEDDEVTAGEEFGAVESVKAASDLFSPVSGTVVEVNSALEDEPELINQDAFANWIIKVKLSDPSELESLMDAAAYREATK